MASFANNLYRIVVTLAFAEGIIKCTQKMIKPLNVYEKFLTVGQVAPVMSHLLHHAVFIHFMLTVLKLNIFLICSSVMQLERELRFPVYPSGPYQFLYFTSVIHVTSKLQTGL